jgi:hypothetical protein
MNSAAQAKLFPMKNDFQATNRSSQSGTKRLLDEAMENEDLHRTLELDEYQPLQCTLLRAARLVKMQTAMDEVPVEEELRLLLQDLDSTRAVAVGELPRRYTRHGFMETIHHRRCDAIYLEWIIRIVDTANMQVYVIILLICCAPHNKFTERRRMNT